MLLLSSSTCTMKTGVGFFLVAVVVVTYLLFQSFSLPYENSIRSLLQDDEVLVYDESSFLNVTFCYQVCDGLFWMYLQVATRKHLEIVIE
jgi:hypothetical protein